VIELDFFVKSNWKAFGVQKMMMNGNGFFFFQFADRKGMMDVLEGGPWLICNRPIFLNIWTPSAKLKKEDLQSVSVWVKFHDVPLVAYSDDGLSMIVSKVGKPLLLDTYTETMCTDNWGRSSYARALIDISAKHGFMDTISLAIPELDGNNYIVENVKVEYESNSPRCERCCVFGHVGNACPKQIVQPSKLPDSNLDDDGFKKVVGRKAAKKGTILVKG
jgi:hypothetical protein